MNIGIFSFEIHLPGARSLKEKRQVVQRLKQRLRARQNVAVAEDQEYANLWQRSRIHVVSVSSQRDSLERLFEVVHREAESGVPGTIIEVAREFLEGLESGQSDWYEDQE